MRDPAVTAPETINKSHLRETMLALSAEELADASSHYQQFLTGTRLDPTEPIENDEQAQARFQGQLAESFEQPLHDAEGKLRALTQLDFDPKSTVEPGAVVCVDGRHFVIGVATGEFSCDGVPMMGIAATAPFYREIEGLQAGDTASFHGRTFRIAAVY